MGSQWEDLELDMAREGSAWALNAGGMGSKRWIDVDLGTRMTMEGCVHGGVERKTHGPYDFLFYFFLWGGERETVHSKMTISTNSSS